MPKDLIERYNHLHYKNGSSIKESEFIDFLYENTESKAPEIDEDAAWNKLVGEIEQKKKPTFAWLKIAASIAVIVSISMVIWKSSSTPEQLHISSLDEKIEVTFPDGSNGILNEQSSFSFPDHFDKERRVSFIGEAYFDIKKSTKPFIIEVGGVEVKVLGTAFNLYSTENSVELYVERGLVAFSKNGVETKVPAGYEASFDKKDFSVDVIESTTPNILSWKDGSFIFDKTPMSEALSQLEKFYDVSFKLSNEEISNCTITATFDQKSLNDVVQTIETLLSLKSNKSGNIIKISGKGC